MRELASKIGVKNACEVLNVSRSRVYRDRQPKAKSLPRPTPSHALSTAEKAGIRGRLLDFHGRGGWSLEVVGHRRRLTFSKNSGGTEIRQDKSIY